MPESTGRGGRTAPLHPISRQHLDELGGKLGIYQHAVGSRPDPAHGYCVDDVARSLQVDLLHARGIGWVEVSGSAWRSLRYLEDAFDPETGRFRNFRSIDGSWLGGPASNDSFGRAMLALGETMDGAPDARLFESALALFARALPAAGKVTSPRAQAAIILGCDAVLRSAGVAGSDDGPEATLGAASALALRRIATGLHARFLDFARPGWPWPEGSLTYENAVLPRALIVAGRRLGADVMLKIGLQVLDWLIEVQTSPQGGFSPVGNGWWPRNGQKSQFDQQPIEATALLLAAEAAHGATGDPRYLEAMERAYAWFLGANDLGVRIADPARGACGDGLTSTGVNTNEGAESTLMWLTAAEHIRLMRSRKPQAKPAVGPRQQARAGSATMPKLSPKPTLVAVPQPPAATSGQAALAAPLVPG
ncbi:MAG TPA: hypothetical protein VL749_00635 [Patescibacteria group bacterium]|nr:hypothetical protein [Patescibacteria group bacterium]